MVEAKRKKSKDTTTIIQKIAVTQIKRGAQDISNWRYAIQSAESITMPRRILLYDLYEEILLDGHLTAVVEKRKLAVTNTPVVYIENGKVHDDITELTTTEDFINLLHYIMESKLWGHSLIELNFDGMKLQPRLIPRKHVEPNKGIVLKHQFDQTGFDYRVAPYTDYTIEVGEENALGLLMKAAQYVIYKRGGFGDWAQYAELFGMPFRVAKYDGYDEKTRSDLETALKEAGSAAYIVIPKEADFEFIQNNAQASNTLFESLINLCNKELSKLILGQTMTTEAGGALAQAKVHQEAEHDLLMADKLFVKNILNDKLIPLLKIHGYNIGKGKFFFREQEHVDMKTRLEMDLKLAEKIVIDDKYFYETYNIPVPTSEGLAKPERSKKEKSSIIMSALGDLYQHLIEALFETVDGIPFVDIDLGQLKKEGEIIQIEYPALIIRFENIFWKEYDASKQLGAVHVRLKFIYPYTNEDEFYNPVAGIRYEVVGFFETIQNIHTAVSSIAPSTHTILYRFNEGHLENKPDELKWIYSMDYYCHIFSDGSSMGDGSTYEIDFSMIQRINIFLENTLDVKKVG